MAQQTCTQHPGHDCHAQCWSRLLLLPSAQRWDCARLSGTRQAMAQPHASAAPCVDLSGWRCKQPGLSRQGASAPDGRLYRQCRMQPCQAGRRLRRPARWGRRSQRRRRRRPTPPGLRRSTTPARARAAWGPRTPRPAPGGRPASASALRSCSVCLQVSRGARAGLKLTQSHFTCKTSICAPPRVAARPAASAVPSRPVRMPHARQSADTHAAQEPVKQDAA